MILIKIDFVFVMLFVQGSVNVVVLYENVSGVGKELWMLCELQGELVLGENDLFYKYYSYFINLYS